MPATQSWPAAPSDRLGGARVMKAPLRREDTCVRGKGWQGWHELFPSVTIRTWESGPGYPAMLGPGGGAVGEEGSLPSSDQETEMSHHLGLQQKPLKGCFRVRTLRPNPFPYPLSQRALAGAAKPQFNKKKKKNRGASWNFQAAWDAKVAVTWGWGWSLEYLASHPRALVHLPRGAGESCLSV